MSKCKYNVKLLVTPKEERTSRAENTSKIIVPFFIKNTRKPKKEAIAISGSLKAQTASSL